MNISIERRVSDGTDGWRCGQDFFEVLVGGDKVAEVRDFDLAVDIKNRYVPHPTPVRECQHPRWTEPAHGGRYCLDCGECLA